MQNDSSKLKIVRLVAVAVVLFSSWTTICAADANYTVLSPLPGTTIGNTGQTNLQTYLPGILKWALGVATVMAFFMITFGGITYMTADAISGKAQGREYIENALWGLLLVIGAWTILYTINPATLDFSKLNIPTLPNTGSAGGPNGSSCSTCVALADTLPKKSGIGNSVAPNLLPKLTSLNQKLQSANVGWLITEAYPPTNSGIHVANSCHDNGTCVDARPTDQSVNNIKTFFAKAAEAGINASYEVPNQAEYDRLKTAGLTGAPSPTSCTGHGTVCINTGTNGAHFHIQ